jgi:transcriptional regulator with XRE-family HTH domain
MPNKHHLLVSFGENLRSHRTGIGISQEELAHRAGLDRSYVGGVERGERNISLINLVKLAHSLGLTASELLQGTEND